jgi:uncharacterized protein involved in exopolysaccharide biosynthesis
MQSIRSLNSESNIFRQYFGVIRNHAWLIGLLVLLFVGLAVVGSVLARPIYQTKTLLLIETKGLTPATASNVSTSQLPAFSKNEILQTQSRIIQSQPLLEEVVLTLRLTHRDEPNDFRAWVRELLRIASLKLNRYLTVEILGRPWSPPPQSDPIDISQATARLRENVLVAPVVQSDLLEIVVTDHDPLIAQRIANTLAQVYIDRNGSLDSLRANTAYLLINKQLNIVQPQLEDSEEALKAFKADQGYLSIEDRATALSNALAKLEADYDETVVQRIETEAKLQELTTRLLSLSDRQEAVTTSSNDTLDLQLKARLLNLESQLAGLIAYQSQAPTPEEGARTIAQTLQIKAEISQVKDQLAGQLDQEVTNSFSTSPNPVYQSLTTQIIDYEATTRALIGKEEILATLIAQNRQALAGLAVAELELQRLSRTVAVNTNIYNNLLQDREQAQANAAIELPNVRIIEAAALPAEPISPNPILNIMIALATGILFGLGLAFWLDYLDETIRFQQDVMTYFELPILGTVPPLKS